MSETALGSKENGVFWCVTRLSIETSRQMKRFSELGKVRRTVDVSRWVIGKMNRSPNRRCGVALAKHQVPPSFLTGGTFQVSAVCC